jgi:hypothetical protein
MRTFKENIKGTAPCPRFKLTLPTLLIAMTAIIWRLASKNHNQEDKKSQLTITVLLILPPKRALKGLGSFSIKQSIKGAGINSLF